MMMIIVATTTVLIIVAVTITVIVVGTDWRNCTRLIISSGLKIKLLLRSYSLRLFSLTFLSSHDVHVLFSQTRLFYCRFTGSLPQDLRRYHSNFLDFLSFNCFHYRLEILFILNLNHFCQILKTILTKNTFYCSWY